MSSKLAISIWCTLY